jgi:hypothetical protein
MVMGFAWQRGWIPLTQDAIMRAIELNGVQVEANKLAFTWGRWCAQDLDKVLALTQPLQVVNFKAREPLQAILQKRMGWLEQYQNKAYAKQYMSFVQDVQQKTSAQVAEAVARKIYRAAGISATTKARAMLERLQAQGYGHLPVCIAKTPYSFTTDPAIRGAVQGHTIDVREVRLSAGAEFVVLVCGDIMTMPGLPAVPAAASIDVDEDGRIVGLF